MIFLGFFQLEFVVWKFLGHFRVFHPPSLQLTFKIFNFSTFVLIEMIKMVMDMNESNGRWFGGAIGRIWSVADFRCIAGLVVDMNRCRCLRLLVVGDEILAFAGFAGNWNVWVFEDYLILCAVDDFFLVLRLRSQLLRNQNFFVEDFLRCRGGLRR